jgi:hypothetical protein
MILSVVLVVEVEVALVMAVAVMAVVAMDLMAPKVGGPFNTRLSLAASTSTGSYLGTAHTQCCDQ